MTWDDFLPMVLPYAKGCPEALALDNIVHAARVFARKTRVWNYEKTIAAVADTAAYAIPAVSGEVVVGVLNCYLGDARYVVRNEGALSRVNVRDGSGNVCMFSRATGQVTLTPAPAFEPQTIYLQVAVQPDLDPSLSSWPDQHEDEARYIAAGALEALCAMPGESWTNPSTVAEKALMFRERIAVVALRVTNTLIPQAKASAATWF